MITPYIPKEDVHPYPVACWDIETSNARKGECIGSGFAWSDSNGQSRYISHPDAQSFIEWLVREIRKTPKNERHRLTTIYAHNGFGFDFQRLLSDLEDADLISNGQIIRSGSQIVGIIVNINKSTKLILRDSMRLMPGKLRDVLKSLDVDTQKLSLDDRLPEEIKETDPALFWEYLRHDVLGLQEAILRFWLLVYDTFGNFGMLPMTLPSLSFRLWRMSLEDEMYTPVNKTMKQLERRAYRGGRVSCFHRGVFDVTTYDANSHYPATMIKHEVPVSPFGGFTDEWSGVDGVYEGHFVQTNTDLPPLLYAEDIGYVYEGDGVFFAPEIHKLESIGGHFECTGVGAVYADMGRPFEIVEEWYRMRKAAKDAHNEGLSFVLKILMNSLYGKFGQREEAEKTIRYSHEKYDEYLDRGITPVIIGNWMNVPDERRNENVFVGIAGYITANARVALYDEVQRWRKPGIELFTAILTRCMWKGCTR